MDTRKAVVADQFYAGSQAACLDELKQSLPKGPIQAKLPSPIVAGIVPHAGWTFSGDLAALVFAAVKQANADVDTFILFGAVHTYYADFAAALYDSGTWQTPLGKIQVDEDLATEIAKLDHVNPDKPCHNSEHSIEVQVPFIQYLFPTAKIVPIMVPPVDAAVQLGTDIADIITRTKDKKIVAIASTDLTHYGPRYGFYPAGPGPGGTKWAKEVNDMEFINFAAGMQAKELLHSAIENSNACGPGAAAAVVATAKALDKKEGILLAHTNSNEVMMKKYNQQSQESVGYAAIVF